MSNDEAVEILRGAGFSQIVPGTHFAPAKDIAKFFGISEISLYSYLDRHRLNRADNPQEALSAELKSFFRRAGLLNIGKATLIKNSNGTSGVFDCHFEKTDSHYVTVWNTSTRFYSARIVLAMIPFMATHHKRYNAEHPTVKLYDKLVWVLAEKRDAEKRVAEEAAQEAAKQAALEAGEGAKKADVHPVVMSEEVLYQLIKKAVSEVMSGATIAIAAPAANT